jgi:amino acid transporter
LLPWIGRAFADAEVPLPAATSTALDHAFGLGLGAAVVIVGLTVLQILRPRGAGTIVVHGAAIVLAMLVIVTLIFALFLPLPHLIDSLTRR